MGCLFQDALSIRPCKLDGGIHAADGLEEDIPYAPYRGG
jgi:hypothetical protein